MNITKSVSSQQKHQPPTLQNLSRVKLRDYFEHTWMIYEMLFSSLVEDSVLSKKPDLLRNPLIFYLGHTAAFYINKLKMAGLLRSGVNDRFDTLFAIGVDPALPEDLAVIDSWPTPGEVKAYRKHVYQILVEFLETVPLDDQTIQPENPMWAFLMGLEHDRIHFETSSVLIRQLPLSDVQRPESWSYAPTFGQAPGNDWIDVSGGPVSLGRSSVCNHFGWDNEFGEFICKVSPFSATRNLISNAEFLEFVLDNGYERQECWTPEGWNWKTRTNSCQPKFWINHTPDFTYRAMFDEIPLPMDWPAEVNAHEAWAFCQWKNDGSRLLSEAEFTLIAREGLAANEDPAFSDGHNLNFCYGSPTPVGFMKNSQSPSGFNDLYGNVWDWLSDDFYPLPGFNVHPLYEDFSEPFMDKEHSMLAGGSWCTTGTGASKYYRLWFRRHFFQHAGFRLAKS